MSTVTIPD